MKDFNAENVARQIIIDSAVMGKVSKLNLLSVLRVLSDWVRSANLRAKTAEEKLREMPNWQSKHRDMSQLYRSSLSALTRAEADAKALEEQSARYAQQNDEMADAYNKKINELEERALILEQGNKDWSALFLADAELRAVETHQHFCILRLVQSGHMRIRSDDSVE